MLEHRQNPLISIFLLTVFYKILRQHWANKPAYGRMRILPPKEPLFHLRSIGRRLFSRLLLGSSSSGCINGLMCVSSRSWCLLLRSWITSEMTEMPRSWWRVSFDTYHGASVITRSILDWDLWTMAILDLLAQPHRSFILISHFLVHCSRRCRWVSILYKKTCGYQILISLLTKYF
jgi:hypothetical protein